jgi:hypothetical protein
MSLSIPITITISDEGIAAIAEALGIPALEEPAPDPQTPPKAATPVLPIKWTLVDQLVGESFRWPNAPDPERYDPFKVYEGTTAEGTIKIGIGRCTRAKVWGRDREYFITFHVTRAGTKYPLCEFLADDEGEFVSVIRGNGPKGRSMFSSDEALPDGYEVLTTAPYDERIHAKGIWRKQVVVASEDDTETMLTHSLIQARARSGIVPK